MQSRLELIQSEIEKGPFKGYLKAEISPAGFVVLHATVSELRYTNREKAYLESYFHLDNLCHESWLYYKFMKGDFKYAMDSEV